MPLIGQRCREGSDSEDSEGYFIPDPFKILERGYLHFDSSHRGHWSFAFTHASTSSKYILSAIQSIFQLNPFYERPWCTVWIVNETINWLKVRRNVILF